MELNTLQILVVDDDADIRQLLAVFLSAHGAMVTCCEDRLSAYHKTTYQKFDFIISDIDMAFMTGVELLSKIRNILRDDPTLILMSRGAEISQSQLIYQLCLTVRLENGGIGTITIPIFTRQWNTAVLTHNDFLYHLF
jgi:CheY-like chemotaxis protein